MTNIDKRAEDREALERLLDVYGADRTRWPARERLRFAGIAGEDKVAARMLAEANALDRLLEQAPRASGADVEALKERIMAAALRSGAPQLAVVAGGKAGVAQPNSATKRGPAFATRFGRGEWPAAAMLAASLVLGVMLGSTGTLDTTMHQMAEVAGLSTDNVNTDSSQLALGDEIEGQSDEDLL
jgi:hypothetical protein